MCGLAVKCAQGCCRKATIRRWCGARGVYGPTVGGMTIAVEHSAALRGTPVKVSTAEDLRQSMASGLLVEVCVRLPRLSPPKSVSLFRPPLAGDSTGARLRLEALHAGPGFHQSAVYREVIRRKKLLHVGLGQDRGHELGRDIALEQSVPVQPFDQTGVPGGLCAAASLAG